MSLIAIICQSSRYRYNQDIKQLEEERSVKYITSAERIGMARGILQGEHKLLILQLKQKFPSISENYLKRVEQEQDERTLCAWGAELINAKTLDEIFD